MVASWSATRDGSLTVDLVKEWMERHGEKKPYDWLNDW
jgi:hypothetical protein